MNQQPVFSEGEWELILDLLQAERRDLPFEIRHTDTHRMREELESRLKMIDGMIARLRPASAPAAQQA